MLDYEKILNRTVVELKPSGIRKLFDIAEKTEDIISLGVGEPDFQTPWHIRETGIESLKQGKTRYTSNWGLKSLREEISRYMARVTGNVYNPENEILITVGGSEAIDGALRTLISQGDEVLIPQPSFVCYEPLTKILGAIPVIIPTKLENEFCLTAKELKTYITPKTKALILPFPNNPTGAVMSKKSLEAIADVLRGTNIIVISDEIYSELTYGRDSHVSVSSIDGMRERTVVINGFSKAFSMTGWRLGFACGPKQILSEMTKIHQFAIMSAPTTAQYAAIEALKNGAEDIKLMKEEYDMRRRIIVDGFNKIGLTCFEPKGAFYAFPCIKSTGLSSDEFCERLVMQEKVALVPGNAFGESGEGFVRASYCYSVDHIKEALKRIEKFVTSLG